jgi:hypothetical protein
MTVQPPGPGQTEPPPPPPVADRRSPERRSGEFWRAEDRAQIVRSTIMAATAVCGGLAILFVFFWALGAVDIKDAVAAAITAVVLAGVWVAGFVYRHRQTEATTVIRHERERRGF